MSEAPGTFLDGFIHATAGIFRRILPRRAAAIALKETHHIARDPYTLGLAIGVPLTMLLLFGFAISYDVKNLRVSILDQDKTPASRALIEAFKGSGFFLPQPSSGDPEQDIASEAVRAAVVIPPGFMRAIGRGESPELQLLVDGSDNSTAGVASAYLQGVAQAAWPRLSSQPVPTEPLRLEPRYIFNPELKSRTFVVPGLLPVIIGLLAVLLTALTVAKEWENGSMELLLSTPATPSEILLGKVSPYVGLGLLAVTLVYGAARLVFHVPFAGSHLILLAASLLFIFVALSFGLIISVKTRNQQMAFQVSMMAAMLPSIFLSGFVFPIESMPLFFRVVTVILPQRWYMVICRGLFLKGSSLWELAVPLLALSLMSVLFLRIAVKNFKSDLEL